MMLYSYKIYKEHLPFELTEAQKRVIREIYADLKSGKANEQASPGRRRQWKDNCGVHLYPISYWRRCSGCTDGAYEILAQQHYNNLKKYADRMGISIALLHGFGKKIATANQFMSSCNP